MFGKKRAGKNRKQPDPPKSKSEQRRREAMGDDTLGMMSTLQNIQNSGSSPDPGTSGCESGSATDSGAGSSGDSGGCSDSGGGSGGGAD